MDLSILKEFISFGLIVCIILALASIFLKINCIGSNSCLKSTMATYAMAYPLGIVKDEGLRKIEIGLLIGYLLFCLLAWMVGYVLEATIKHKTYKKWKGRITPWVLYWDIGYFLLGVVSIKVLDIIRYIASFF
jgi:hypothetical protein